MVKLAGLFLITAVTSWATGEQSEIHNDTFSSVAWRKSKWKNNTLECASYHTKSNESFRCSYIKSIEDCHLEDGFLQYIYFPYCTMPQDLVPLACALLVFWMIFMFIGLGVTAEEL